MFLAYLNASFKVDASRWACMNYHFSLRAFPDQVQQIETIYSSNFYTGPNSYLAVIYRRVINQFTFKLWLNLSNPSLLAGALN